MKQQDTSKNVHEKGAACAGFVTSHQVFLICELLEESIVSNGDWVGYTKSDEKNEVIVEYRGVWYPPIRERSTAFTHPK